LKGFKERNIEQIGKTEFPKERKKSISWSRVSKCVGGSKVEKARKWGRKVVLEK